jgi:nitrogen-specific signal transduction histidine kinase
VTDPTAVSNRQKYTTEQLAAVGDVALQLLHGLNNPLSALLAEAQLLQLEPLTAEQADAVGRIVDLCRRVVRVSKDMDGATRAAGGIAAAV